MSEVKVTTIGIAIQTSALDTLDGLASTEQFLRIRQLYLEQLGVTGEQVGAEDRRQLLRLAQRALDLVDDSDLFLQSCDEHIRDVADTSEFAARLESTLASDRVPDRAKGLLAGKDAVQVALTGIASGRAMLAETRNRLSDDLARLHVGSRPSSISEDIPAGAVAGIGAGWIAAGAALLAGAALAPKTAGASAVAGVAIAGAILEGAGIGAMAAALSR